MSKIARAVKEMRPNGLEGVIGVQILDEGFNKPRFCAVPRDNSILPLWRGKVAPRVMEILKEHGNTWRTWRKFSLVGIGRRCCDMSPRHLIWQSDKDMFDYTENTCHYRRRHFGRFDEKDVFKTLLLEVSNPEAEEWASTIVPELIKALAGTDITNIEV